MSKIEVRGVIVPALYDCDMWESYIQKGVVTPESRFRKMLEDAKKDEDLSCYINSPGGSVFSGNEMINALADWKKNTGKEIHFTVGAMAASMAAVMLVNTNAKISVHKNTKIMFHGAFTETYGGEQAHKDTADLLAKMNNDCKATLISKYNLSPETVGEWFAEGRAGWLTAEDAKKIGLAVEIIDKDGEKPKFSKTTMNMLSERGLMIAAAIEPELEMEVENVPAQSGEQSPATTEPDKGNAVFKSFATEADFNAFKSEIGCSFEAEKAKIKADLLAENQKITAEFTAKLAEKDTKIEGLNKALNDKQSKLDKAINDITELASKLDKLTGGGMNFEPDCEDWNQALAKCGGDYVKARKSYPGLFSKFIEKHKN